ncbi:MAG: homocysteine S-methyltransferase family protein [Planctomycetota bacterium]|jgi:S-methylmethionine-dependent homocysteine/selenocysteine methylase
MTRYRSALPQTEGKLFLTDSGLETTLLFHDGIELPQFAAFPLLENAAGRTRLRAYFTQHAAIAKAHGLGFVLETVTWRASSRWGALLGYDAARLADINRDAVEFLVELRDDLEDENSPMPISGQIGPRGDGYDPSNAPSADEAQAYHATQVTTLRNSNADFLSAFTMPAVEEAIGVARAAREAGMPLVVSFTTETDGRLPTGQSLPDAIQQVDECCDAPPVYYMINCAHPTHFDHALEAGEAWTRRIRGIRANASVLSHAELDEATELDDGNPVEFGGQYGGLRHRLGHLSVLGGCCGTDHRHVEAIARACA